MKHLLVDVMPYYYATVLRWVSPLFTLLEGISTLLVIQVAGRVGKGWADEEEREEGVEWRGLLGLVAAALVYCAGLAGVIKVGGPFHQTGLVNTCRRGLHYAEEVIWHGSIPCPLHCSSLCRFSELPTPAMPSRRHCLYIAVQPSLG